MAEYEGENERLKVMVKQKDKEIQELKKVSNIRLFCELDDTVTLLINK